MTEQFTSQNRIEHDEVSLVDLWLVMVAHRKIFWILFSLTVICGLVFSLLKPTIYTVTSTIEIGKLIQNGENVLIESPETVKAKLEMALGPSMLQEDGGKRQLSKFTISIPKNSKLVSIQNQVESDAVSTTKSLQERLINRLIKDHNRILNLHQAQTKAEILKAKEQLYWLQDERLQRVLETYLKAQIQHTKATLTLITDPVVTGYKKNELNIKLDIEKLKLDSLKGQEVLLGQKVEHLEKLTEILVRQTSELKQKNARSTGLDKIAASEVSNGSHALSLLIASNELHQNIYCLAELEKQLFIGLENQKANLQHEINENKRLQVHQIHIIAQQETSIAKFEIENQLKTKKQITEVARVEASLAEREAHQEQEIALKTLEIDELKVQIENLVGTQAVTAPLRSQEPTGSSSAMIIILSALLGLVMGTFGIFMHTLIQKARSYKKTN